MCIQKLTASKVRAALAGIKAGDAAKVCSVCPVCLTHHLCSHAQSLEDPYEDESDHEGEESEEGEKRKGPKDAKAAKEKDKLGGHSGVAAEAASAAAKGKGKKGKSKAKEGILVVRACVVSCSDAAAQSTRKRSTRLVVVSGCQLPNLPSLTAACARRDLEMTSFSDRLLSILLLSESMTKRSFSKQIDLFQIVLLPESINRLEMGRDEIDLIDPMIVKLRIRSRNRKV